MKSILTLAAVVSVLACSAANAASLTAMPTNASNPDVWSVFVDGAELNGGFDTVIFSATPQAGTSFATVGTGIIGGAPRPAGFAGTYRNRVLDLDPEDEENPGVGLGWTIVGIVNTANEIAFVGGPIGFPISTPAPTPEAPGLFLANFSQAPGAIGSASVQLVNAGTVVFESTIDIGIIPEPASFGLAGIAMLGLAAVRRRLA